MKGFGGKKGENNPSAEVASKKRQDRNRRGHQRYIQFYADPVENKRIIKGEIGKET